MITINKQQLKDLNACQSGLERFITSTKYTECDVCVIDLISTDVTTSDLIWLAGKILPKKKIVQFAVDCAESVVHLSINKELSQNCIDATKAVIENDNITNRNATRAAAGAADAEYSGTYADYSAVYAARVAAGCPATAAANADTTANYADYSATAADGNLNVNPLLVKLFTK